MLRHLRINNFALIEHLDLSLEKGYSVITGETGSGKSILLGALELLLGERADFSLIGPVSEKASVEAEFDLSSFDLKVIFEENDIDYSDQTIVRREINQSGRSRAFINDTPVQLNILKELTSRLVYIHSQYNTLELKSKQFQLDVLDVLSGLMSEREVYGHLYAEHKSKHNDLKKLKADLAELLKQKDYNQFQLQELDELNLMKVNFSEMERDFNLIENSNDIKIVLASLNDRLSSDQGVLSSLAELKSNLDKIKHFDSDLEDYFKRINSVLVELKELDSDVYRKLDAVDIDPAKLDELTQRLDKYNHLLRKHNVNEQRELIELFESFSQSIEGTEKIEQRIDALELEVNALHKRLIDAGNHLHEGRIAKIAEIEGNIQSLLSDLKLVDTRFNFHLTKKEDISATGITDIVMLFSANKGMEPIAIEKAASGGELSRVMLALQKLISEKKQLPTVLFDEIDTGVSGEVAQKIGTLLDKMSNQVQLLAITHLPQVAAKAKHHFKVEKNLVNDRTLTSVRLLNEEDHIHEVARLMSGEEISDAAILNAKNLMNS
ncbi:MAG: DNA repair protein RecN [Crocinitomicaceae bacterium]|nr:DNA repair protein RecN [Crocinitomicaceae bacterium]